MSLWYWISVLGIWFWNVEWLLIWNGMRIRNLNFLGLLFLWFGDYFRRLFSLLNHFNTVSHCWCFLHPSHQFKQSHIFWWISLFEFFEFFRQNCWNIILDEILKFLFIQHTISIHIENSEHFFNFLILGFDWFLN